MPVNQSTRRPSPWVALLLALSFVAPGAMAAEGDFEIVGSFNSVTGSYLAGQRALQDLRTTNAASFLRDAVEADFDNPFLVEPAFIAFAADGDVGRAADTARHFLELTDGGDLARLVVGTDELKSGKYDDAIATLSAMGEASFIGLTGQVLSAWAEIGAGRADDGLAAIERLVDGGLGEFLVFHRALMAEVAGRQDAAIAFAKAAYDGDPLVARIVEAYARMLGNAGRYDEALAVLRTYNEQGYDHALLAPVRAALDRREPPGPFTRDVQSGAAEMFHSIGVALARDGGRGTSVIFLQLGRYLDPRSDVIALVLGQLYDAADNHEAANAIYDRIAATSPMKSTAVIRTAENFDAMGDRAEAIRRLSNIAVANPDDLDALSVLGDLQRTDGRYADAAATYTKALAVAGGDHPGDWRFYYVRGISYERNKEWDKAEVDFQRALELNPDQPQVLNYLGYSWVDKGINLVPALEMIEKAVAAAPNDGYIIDSLGWAFYRLGRYEEAVVELEKAVRLRSADPEINDHLGDAYWMAGRRLEARFQWNIAASVDEPDGTVRPRATAKLTAETPDLGVDAIVVAEAEDTPASEPAPAAEPAPAPVPAPAAAPPAAEPVAPSTPASAPAPAAPLAAEPAPAPRTVTVAPGDSLWTIARDTYGAGIEFRLIVDANRDKLLNPNRIKPGLVLVLPEKP